jgi:hypothetical protein
MFLQVLHTGDDLNALNLCHQSAKAIVLSKVIVRQQIL